MINLNLSLRKSLPVYGRPWAPCATVYFPRADYLGGTVWLNKRFARWVWPTPNSAEVEV